MALSNAARDHPDYIAVAARGVDEVFGTTGRALEVDHVFPRSRIALKPGFAELSWEDQINIFSFEPNLKSIPQNINNFRSNTPYAELVHSDAMHQLGADAAKISEMAKLEKTMEAAIERMIANPSTIPKRLRP